MRDCQTIHRCWELAARRIEAGPRSVTVQGRQGGKRSRLTVAVYRTDDGRIRARLGDELDPGFGAEVTVDPQHLPAPIHVYEPVAAVDFLDS